MTKGDAHCKTNMKGWEVYAKDWGCEDWNKDSDMLAEALDNFNHNSAMQWCPAPKRRWTWYFLRQPTPVQVRLWVETNRF